MSDDDIPILNRRRVLAMLTGEFAKMAALTATGAATGAIISYVQLDGVATIAARNEIRNAGRINNIELDESALVVIAKKQYDDVVKKGVVQTSPLGGFLGNMLYEPICGIPAPEPDIY